jgi:DNA polymerase-3 subunit delta
MSMLEDKKIIIIKEVNESAFGNIQQALLQPPHNCYIIITSHKLSVKSTLNQLFEQSEHMASIGCWQESGRELEQLIRQNLRQHRLDYGLIKKLAEYLQGDSLFALSELNKLSLYLVNKPNATEEEIISCIVDSSEKTLDSLCLAAADRDIPKFIALSEELLYSISPISAIRALYNYFYRLEKTLSLAQQGLNMQQAMSRLRPPVFFKNMHHFKRHLAEWKIKNLREMLRNMLKLEINCKQSTNSKHIFKQFMIITILELK